MDNPDDLIPLIIAKIKALEPENASICIYYLLLQDMKYAELFRMAFEVGPYRLIQEFCRKAKSEISDLGHDARLESEQHRYWFQTNGFGTPGGFVSPSEEIAQPQQQRMIAARGSPMSNIQGSRQFGVEGGLSPGSHKRKDLDSKELFFTFLAESSFTYEDVSAYFSKFGPVEDVKIPYQKQRRYGSVVFAKAETVRTLLARDNRHFICGSIVRLKPSKEIGKIPQKQGSGQFGVEGAYVSTSENTAQPQQQRVIAASGSPMSIIQGSGQFGVEGAYVSQSENTAQPQQQRVIAASGSPMSNMGQQHQLDQQLEGENNTPSSSPSGPMMSSNETQENKSIHDHQHIPIASLIHFPSLGTKVHIDSGRKHDRKVAAINKERGHSNVFYEGQETSLENTLADSLIGSETRQTESDTEQDKEGSPDQSA